MYNEDELLPISGLQHLAFCPRQCMLIHLERCWNENELTASGRVMHERVHQGPDETRGNVRTVRGLPLRSLRLGLAGVADAVEFHRVEQDSGGVSLPNRRGLWLPYSVEYKHGRPKKGNCDSIQVCAQAICLEEMLGCFIVEGSLFYGETRHRTVVSFDDKLREQTEQSAKRFHDLISMGKIPPAEKSSLCKSCSLKDYCMPQNSKSVLNYINRHLGDE